MKNTIKKAWLLAVVFIVVAILNIPLSTFARITGTPASGEQDDRVCWGPSGAEVCVNVDGDIVPTTDNDTTLGTAALQWAAGFLVDLTISNSLDLNGTADISGKLTMSGAALGIFSRTKAQIQALTPVAVGELYFCSDCLNQAFVLVSTGTGLSDFAAVGLSGNTKNPEDWN